MKMSLALKKIEKTVWISNKDFENKWELWAIEYREIIRILANKFSDGDCELTHSEYFIDKDDKCHIVLCIDFFKDENDIYWKFKKFISENIELIEKIRKKFNVSIWFNYWEINGFCILDKKIVSISYDKFMNYPIEWNIPHRSKKGYKNVERLLDNINKEIISLFSEI